jgi:hypothetical protein
MGRIEVKTPNGIEINAHIIHSIANVHICYAQNRLFTLYETAECIDGEFINEVHYGETITDYCVIPELDNNETKEITDNSRR